MFVKELKVHTVVQGVILPDCQNLLSFIISRFGIRDFPDVGGNIRYTFKCFEFSNNWQSYNLVRSNKETEKCRPTYSVDTSDEGV